MNLTLKNRAVFTVTYLDEPSKNYSHLLGGGEEVDALVVQLKDWLGSMDAGRGKRIVVTNISRDYSLKPGARRLRRGEILPNGTALAKDMGLKSPSSAARALWKSRQEKPETITGHLQGVEIAYVEDYDREYGAGAAENFSRGMQKQWEEGGDLY